MGQHAVHLIVGDNGAAAAGGIPGCFNEMVALNGLQEDPKIVISKMEEFGGPKASNQYPVGFAWALCTPFQFTKQFASHFGGTRNSMIITWPKRIPQGGQMRDQFHHVIGIAPTIFEAAGIPAPTSVNGVAQRELDGISMVYTFDRGGQPGKRKTQYFEIMGTRGIYQDGWMACTYHNKLQWKPTKLAPFDQDRWELYHVQNDYSQAVDLAEKEPGRLADLKALFIEEGKKNQVLPLDDRGSARALNARPSIVGDRKRFSFRAGAIRMPEDIIRTTFNRSYEITCEIEVPENRKAEGVIVAAGGYFAGLSLYLQEGRPMFTYNYFGSKYTTIGGQEPLKPGKATVRYEFAYDGGGLGKGGVTKLFVNDKQVAEGKIDATVPLAFTADETLDVGLDTGTPAADTYEGTFPFTGAIQQVTFELK